MTDSIEPLSDRDGDPLAALVVHGRALDVDYDVDAGLARHHAAVAAAPPAGWWPRLVSPTTGGIAIVLIAVGAVIAWRFAAHDREPAPPTIAIERAVEVREVDEPRERDDAPAEIVPAIPSTPLASATAEPPEPEPEPEPRPARVPPRRATPPTDAPVEPAATTVDDDSLAREAAQIRRARALLERGDAKSALAICSAGDREFPHGTFVPERSGIRVLALHALGRPDRVAARAWLARWPNGTLAPRIRRTLDGDDATARP